MPLGEWRAEVVLWYSIDVGGVFDGLDGAFLEEGGGSGEEGWGLSGCGEDGWMVCVCVVSDRGCGWMGLWVG